jgi:hypothetical protein
MVQFYALSVFVNVISGLLLAGDGEKPNPISRLKDVFGEKGTKFSLGLFSLIIGLFKILTPVKGDIAVIGDLLPALSGLTLGGVLLLDFFKASSEMPSKMGEKADNFVISNKKFFGIVGIAIGALHFLIPGVPIF